MNPVRDSSVDVGELCSTPQVEEDVKSGVRPIVPTDAVAGFPPQYTALMQRCWHQLPANRPTFEEIVKELDGIIGSAPHIWKVPLLLAA